MSSRVRVGTLAFFIGELDEDWSLDFHPPLAIHNREGEYVGYIDLATEKFMWYADPAVIRGS